jgi:recombination protein RecR
MAPLEPLEQLVKLLSRLPGVGQKSATRLAFHLVEAPSDYVSALSQALTTVADQIHNCPICGNYTASETCALCSDPRRDPSQICVVAKVQDLIALERVGGYRGRYHVLHGLLDPLRGVGPDDLPISQLLERIGQADPPVKEVILAISPSAEGDTTMLYLTQQLAPHPVRVTRIAAGVPIGEQLEYTDQVTLGRALAERREM